jgi:alginate O-acetyltransferase complex protein AlgJ
MNKCTIYKLEKLIILVIFLLSIYLPFIGSFVQKGKTVSSVENRNLAKLPDLPQSLRSFVDYPERFNAYYTDNFGFRDILTETYYQITDKRVSKTQFDDVTFGRNDWLFLGSIKPGYDRYDDPIGDAINRNLFTENELIDFTQSIMEINNWLKNKGIEYLYIIAPNKHTIYFENLPEYISKIGHESSTDQLVNYLLEHTDVNVLDLRQPLIEQKKKHQVYFKTDSHWNHYGANVAQYEIMKKISNFFPNKISPHLLRDNQFKITHMNGGDLAGLAKLQNIMETNPQPIFERGCIPVNENPAHVGEKTHTIVCETKTLNALIFRDSFFWALKPYISREFKRSTYIWGRLDYLLLTEYIDKENPDIVIEEVVERSLPYKLESTLFHVSD